MKKIKHKLMNVGIVMLSCLFAFLLNQQDTAVSNEAEKIVALTYDDGPSEISTAALLEILDKHDAHATFFVNGNHALENKELITAIVEQGSEIGNHTLDHVWLTKVDEAEAMRQVIGNEHLLRFLSGQEGVMLLRPPYGDINQEILDQFNLPIVLWSADSRDWEVKNVERIIANVLSEIEDGGIIIMHDGYRTTVEATDELLKILREQNYKVVSVSEMFALKNQSMPLHEKIKKVTE